jgi:hypothetical protein
VTFYCITSILIFKILIIQVDLDGSVSEQKKIFPNYDPLQTPAFVAELGPGDGLLLLLLLYCVVFWNTRRRVAMVAKFHLNEV